MAGVRKTLGAKGARATGSVPDTVMAGVRKARGDDGGRAEASVPLTVMAGVRKANPAAGAAGLTGVVPGSDLGSGLGAVVITGGFWTGAGAFCAKAVPASNAANPAAATRPVRMVNAPQVNRKLAVPERLG